MRVLLMVVAMALLVAGCFGTEEDVLVRDDGTVLYTIEYSIAVDPESEAEIMALFMSVDLAAGDSVRRREFVEGDDHHYVIEREYASLEHLVAASAVAEADEAAAEAAGLDTLAHLPCAGLRLERLDGTHARFVRLMDERPDSSNDWMVDMSYAGRLFVFRLHAPAIDSATGVVAADRKSAEWQAPLTEADHLKIGAVIAIAPAPASAPGKKRP